MAAPENVLGGVHEAIATRMLARLADPDADISAAEMSNMLKFLKDNNITCAPAADNALGEMEAMLAKRNQRKPSGAMPTELKEAIAELGHTNLRVN